MSDHQVRAVMATEIEAVKELHEVSKGKEILNEVVQQKVVNEAAEVPKRKELLNEVLEEEITDDGRKITDGEQEAKVVNKVAGVAKEKELLNEAQEDDEEYDDDEEEYEEEEDESAPIPEKVVLMSSDKQEFELLSTVAMQSEVITRLLKAGVVDSRVYLSHVSGSVLAKVVDYWITHAALESGSDELKIYDKEFVQIERDELLKIVLAANYLHTMPLLDLTAQAVSDIIMDMSPKEVHDFLTIKIDVTPKEEDEIQVEDSKAFDD